jgi:hypothetical protein
MLGPILLYLWTGLIHAVQSIHCEACRTVDKKKLRLSTKLAAVAPAEVEAVEIAMGWY